METISALVVLSGRIHQSQVDSPLKGPVMRSFVVLYVVSLDKLIYIYIYIYMNDISLSNKILQILLSLIK